MAKELGQDRRAAAHNTDNNLGVPEQTFCEFVFVKVNTYKNFFEKRNLEEWAWVTHVQ